MHYISNPASCSKGPQLLKCLSLFLIAVCSQFSRGVYAILDLHDVHEHSDLLPVSPTRPCHPSFPTDADVQFDIQMRPAFEGCHPESSGSLQVGEVLYSYLHRKSVQHTASLEYSCTVVFNLLNYTLSPFSSSK